MIEVNTYLIEELRVEIRKITYLKIFPPIVTQAQKDDPRPGGVVSGGPI